MTFSVEASNCCVLLWSVKFTSPASLLCQTFVETVPDSVPLVEFGVGPLTRVMKAFDDPNPLVHCKARPLSVACSFLKNKNR